MLKTLLAGLMLLQTSPDPVWWARAAVTDAKGQPVRDLAHSDVALVNDGAALTVDAFERDERPMRIILLVDSSQPFSTAYRIQFVDAAKSFVASMPETARISVWTTGERPTRIIEDLDLSQSGATRELEEKLRRVAPSGGNTVLDAVAEAAQFLSKGEGARQVVVFLSGEGAGFVNDTRNGIVDRVRKTRVEVTGVLIGEAGDGASGGEVSGEDYDYVLGNLTRDGAGLYERPLSTMGAVSALRRVATDLLSTYRLSFHFPASRRFRLKLQVARPDVKIRLSTPQKETPSP